MRKQLRKLYKTADIVYEVLTDEKATRNSDNALYVAVCRRIKPECVRMQFEQVLLNIERLNLPSYETVSRARRKLQADNPELSASENVAYERAQNENDFIDFAIN